MRYQRHLSLIVSFDHDFFPYELKSKFCKCNELLLRCFQLAACDVSVTSAGLCFGGVVCSQQPFRQLGLVQKIWDSSLCLVVVGSCFSHSRVPDRALITLSFCILCFFCCVVLQRSPRFLVSLDNYCSQISD